MAKLIEGLHLSTLWWPDGAIIRVDEELISIVVSMEYGQGNMVPWALAAQVDGPTHLYNLAFSQGVTFQDENPNELQRGSGDGD